MSSEAFTPQPATEEQVAEKDSYLGDPSRSASSHGEAIFGDKQAHLLENLADLSPTGQSVAEKYSTDETREAVSHAAAILALHEAAANGNWDQARVDLVSKQIEAK